MKYPGLQATMWSHFGKTRFQVKVDLGFGDLVTPTVTTIPLMRSNENALFESQIKVSCYPKEFIFAEKLETVVYRAANNSRMKDFHDIHILIQSEKLEAKATEEIITTVFQHRGTEILFPISFSADELSELQKFWTAHLKGLPRSHVMPHNFEEVYAKINHWVTKNTSLCQA